MAENIDSDQWRHFSQSLGSSISYSTTSLSPCVICKKHPYRIGSAIALPSEKHYRLPFELAGSEKFLHFTILGVHRPPTSL